MFELGRDTSSNDLNTDAKSIITDEPIADAALSNPLVDPWAHVTLAMLHHEYHACIPTINDLDFILNSNFNPIFLQGRYEDELSVSNVKRIVPI